ncbi:hypothetical protein TTHERM_00189580 (macronuclear) [Tetrahymena thermophila SB210]|uniref:Uncharacterized protein n=1 Tax=Tetrahymena thermophila (strain SB210) TaxID=312017 RepID=I7LV01_TETTS|nr:hypothetical protein TTHERM_00189580 [Tetrahymena thermophila SB210]EAR96389.1 hypothetical protein TTHERM_00189580 [Tetrahymena thermophila SB210]|eukprot:XP_001016634.1 hypothetical protein TTHERM_00189580 [Tetrahymena thermophila SB210]
MNTYNFQVNIEEIYLEQRSLNDSQNLMCDSEDLKHVTQETLTNIHYQHQESLSKKDNHYNITSEENSYQMNDFEMVDQHNQIQLPININQKDKSSNFSQVLGVKKFIIKTRRTSSKRFKRKQYQSLYTHLEDQYPNNNKFIIFGYVEIEATYSNFSENLFEENSSLYKRLLQINHAVDNKIQRRVELNLDCIGKSGLTNFTELITYFNSQQNQNFQQLAQQLSIYQPSLLKQLAHLKEIKKMITKKQISECNLVNAFSNSHNYLIEYLNEKNNFLSKSDYSHVLFFRSNMTFIDTEIYQSHYSYSFLELLGINIEDAKNTIQVFSPYQIKNGEQRLKNAITFLSIINSKQKFHTALPYTITTKDGIQIDCTIDVDIISSEDNPSWMNSQDSFMMIINFNINEQQQKQIFETRNQVLNFRDSIYKKQSIHNKGIEEQVQLEIFLQKYYPKSFTNICG